MGFTAARGPTLELAILGVLRERRMHGYELRHYLSFIYRALVTNALGAPTFKLDRKNAWPRSRLFVALGSAQGFMCRALGLADGVER
jgi:hypothetical protein